MRANPDVANVQFDWDEKSKVIRLDIDQEKARACSACRRRSCRRS